MFKGTVDVGGDADFFELGGGAHCRRAAGIGGIVHFFRTHYLNHEIGVVRDAVILFELVQRHFAA